MLALLFGLISLSGPLLGCDGSPTLARRPADAVSPADGGVGQGAAGAGADAPPSTGGGGEAIGGKSNAVAGAAGSPASPKGAPGVLADADASVDQGTSPTGGMDAAAESADTPPIHADAATAGTGGGATAGTGGATVGTGSVAGASSDLYPLMLAPGKRHLIDQAGRPFMIFGDSPWECVTMLSSADVASYFDDRRAKGFNTLLIELFEHTTAHPFGAATLDGQHAFTKALPGSSFPDFSAPNDAYFAHVDEIVALAGARGFLVLFTPAYLGYQGGAEGWYQEMLANGVERLTAFGNYLGKRYARFPNIMWVDGGDFNPPNKTLTRAVANGIKAFDTKHLHTVHAADGTSGLDEWPGEPWLDVDTVYDDIAITHVPIYTPARNEYTRADHKPFFLIESCYEEGGCGDEVLIRQQAYETLLTGGFGQIFSRGSLWAFPSNWRSLMQSQGAFDMKRVRDLFAPRRWDLLLPDVDGTFLTAGAGTGGAHASAAWASDGSFAIVYTPAIRDLTLDMSRFAKPVAAHWYDPTNGTFTSAGAALPNSGSQTFHPAGSNGRGKADWVLVLEAR